MPEVQSIFDSVPRQDRFKLFNGPYPNYKKVREVLHFSKEDVAQASSVPVSSVRYDERIPEELIERMKEWAIAISLVGQYFDDLDRTILWFTVRNPALGGISPRDMIRIGRFNKLFNFIFTALNENKKE